MINITKFPYESELNIQKYWVDIQNIYAHISDEESKEIYICRLLLTFTGDVKFIRELVLKNKVGLNFKKFLSEQNEIYIYGAGIRGKRIVQMFPEMMWKKYIDRKCVGSCNDIAIIKPNELQLEDDAIILITNYEGYEEVKKDLLSLGISKRQIVCMSDFEKKAQENQYFEERCVKNFKKTSGDFIDAGCFDGRDSIRFLESNLNNNGLIYAFEPDGKNFQECKKIFKGYKNIKICDLGLSDSTKEGIFLSAKGEKARVTSEGNCSIKLDTIDNLMYGKQIGFIKMDIEGSEKDAIIGARKHIEADKPNMMISIYHKIEDVIEIPKLLLEMNPEYRFAFGHYSIGSAADTVLYAFE